jgi:hypothetical protein
MTTDDKAEYHLKMCERWKRFDTPIGDRMMRANKRLAESYLQIVSIQNYFAMITRQRRNRLWI